MHTTPRWLFRSTLATLATVVTVVTLVGCGDNAVAPTPKRQATAGSARELQIAGDYACALFASPESATIGIGEQATITAKENYCFEPSPGVFSSQGDPNWQDATSPVFFSNDNSAVASMSNGGGEFGVTNVTVTGVAPGTANITLTDCGTACPPLSYTVPVTVIVRTLTATISGPTDVNTGRSGCIYDVDVTGGFPPYANDYEWTVENGTITSGQGTTEIRATFNSDGEHLVSVQAFDSHDNNITGRFDVNSTTTQEFTCPAT